MDESLIMQRLSESAKLHDEIKGLAPSILRGVDMWVGALGTGHKIIFFGNGGSAADAQHLACELVVKYRLDRAALAAIALSVNTSVLTAAANDRGFEQIFARQIEALAAPGDVAVAISTSGASPNVLAACRAARAVGCRVMVLTGARGCKLSGLSDLAIEVPSEETDRIQEAHIVIGHIVCELVEAALAGERGA